MLTSELVHEIKKRTGIPKRIVRETLDAFCEITKEEMGMEGSVLLPLFGKFIGFRKKARTYRNPSTGEKIVKGSTISAKFSPAIKLRKYLRSKS
jgi:nucleoid DNA-binding protein